LAADPKTIVLVRYQIDPAQAVPDSVRARLLLNSQTTDWYYYQSDQVTKGGYLQIALRNTTLPATDRYGYTVTVEENRGGTLATLTYTGTTAIVNEVNSPFGSGWTLQGLDRLFTSPTGGGGVLLNIGMGRSLWFASGGTFTSPSGD